jgi:hypothetical protein
MPASYDEISMAVQEVMRTGYELELIARQLAVAQIQLRETLKTQPIAIALEITFHRDWVEKNREAQQAYQAALDYQTYVLTR